MYFHIEFVLLYWIYILISDKMDCCLPDQQFWWHNAEAEKNEYVDHIQEIFECMEWKPFKVTYADMQVIIPSFIWSWSRVNIERLAYVDHHALLLLSLLYPIIILNLKGWNGWFLTLKHMAQNDTNHLHGIEHAS